MIRPVRFARLLVLGTAALAALAAAGCGSSNSTSPSGVTDVSKLTIVDLVVGTGATAVTGSTATVDYSGWYYDPSKPEGKGTLLDSSDIHGPFTFKLGTGAAIGGFDQGVNGMKVGGQRRVTMPSALAYGTGALIFDITLVSVS
jgi:FKBP-type peptidyl-prolyl cis-trans isomerase FkpA